MQRIKLNILKKENAIRIDKLTIGKEPWFYTHYTFVCSHENCNKEIKIRSNHLSYSTGKCKKHAQMKKPFEAVYGGLKRNAKERRLKFELTYEDYLQFTKQKICTYCGDGIKWTKWNEHGKNNPGYYLDRKNHKLGYLKHNLVVCCTICNMAKRAMSYEKFINMCLKVSNKHKGGSCGT